MDAIAGVNSSATLAAQAVQAGQANTATSAPKTAQPAISGLPPVRLSAAASDNAVNAALVSSQWGVDPGTVGGVYGGAGQDGGMFSGQMLLPLLTNMSHAHAEQALTLIGIQTPKPAATSSPAAAYSSSAAATSPEGQAALNQAVAATTSSSPMMVDPLWGRTA